MQANYYDDTLLYLSRRRDCSRSGHAAGRAGDGHPVWKKLETGIPPGDKGRIAFSMSQSNPNILIALVEHQTESGTYRTEDAGATWKKMSRSNPVIRAASRR